MTPKSGSTPDPIDVAVGARVRLAHKTLGLSQEALAKAVEITFQQIQKYERGANRVGADVHQHKAVVLGALVAPT